MVARGQGTATAAISASATTIVTIILTSSSSKTSALNPSKVTKTQIDYIVRSDWMREKPGISRVGEIARHRVKYRSEKHAFAGAGLIPRQHSEGVVGIQENLSAHRIAHPPQYRFLIGANESVKICPQSCDCLCRKLGCDIERHGLEYLCDSWRPIRALAARRDVSEGNFKPLLYAPADGENARFVTARSLSGAGNAGPGRRDRACCCRGHGKAWPCL